MSLDRFKEFVTGVKNVLRRENRMEALSICDATPGPVARLVKMAILNQDQGSQYVDDVLESANDRSSAFRSKADLVGYNL